MKIEIIIHVFTRFSSPPPHSFALSNPMLVSELTSCVVETLKNRKWEVEKGGLKYRWYGIHNTHRGKTYIFSFNLQPENVGNFYQKLT